VNLSPTSQQVERKRSEVKSFRTGSGIWGAVLFSISGTCKRNLNFCKQSVYIGFTKKIFLPVESKDKHRGKPGRRKEVAKRPPVI